MDQGNRSFAPAAPFARRIAVRAGRFCRRLRDDTRASSAMEFALVAPVLFALLLATLQLVLIFLAQAALETACEGSARYVMTGQAQTNFNGTATATSQQQFNTYVCSQLQGFMGCGYLYADVVSGTSYSTISLAEPTWTFNSSGTLTNTFTYSPGTQGAIVVVRLYYFWPVVSIFGFSIFNATNTYTTSSGAVSSTNYDVLIATSVAKTEGY